MKTCKLMNAVAIVISLTSYSCSSKPDKEDIKNQIIGKYSREGENEYDHYKDTIEVRALDNGKFDVAEIAIWSAAKKNDTQRPFNKVAGVWNNQGAGKTRVAELQLSDTTLRITDPLGEVTILRINTDNQTLAWPLEDGKDGIYHKVK